MQRAAGPFEVLEILGEGSFGTVCVARVTGDPLRRKVALKILKVAYVANTKILNRTRDEARLLSRINHPNIVRVERLMEVNERPVVVMEHVQGVALDALLLRFKDGLPGAIAVEVVRQTCLALHVAYAEALGDEGRPLRVIHRDIKPSNILLSIHGEVKVVDFGIAKGEFDGREAKTESVVMGSRPYMAPERLDGVSDNPSVDVYSAGMTLFELLTGRHMNLSINPVTHDQTLNRHLGYVKVPGMSEPVLEDLRNLLRRMCAYTRDYRPSSVECARDLEQLLYAIDGRYRIALEEFARTTVLPIYESRPRIAPIDVFGEGDDQFFREVTGALTGDQPGDGDGPFRLAPYLFLGSLTFVITLMLILVVAVQYKRIGVGDADGPSSALGDESVRVNLFLPSDAQVQVGAAFRPNSGHVRIPAGPTNVQLYFDEGTQYTCGFDAVDNLQVRVVFDAKTWGLSIDDGPAEPCSESIDVEWNDGAAVPDAGGAFTPG
ncbi:MAG: protein kinase [Rhodobacterales bacterium]|nr:protein kinase [Rhodobacterales bacterium]